MQFPPTHHRMNCRARLSAGTEGDILVFPRRQIPGIWQRIDFMNNDNGRVLPPPPPPIARVWGLDYHAINMEQSLDYLVQVIRARTPSYAITANLNYAMLCSKIPRLKTFTERASLVLCDGMPALWRSKLGLQKLPERVAGADLIYRLSERCAAHEFRIYFYGAAEGVAEKTATKLKQLYPELVIAGVQCPPFRDTSREDIQSQIAAIREAKPDVLLVALGQPKGEFWIEEHLHDLGVPLCIQLGASFDFVAGNAKRAPMLWQRIGLEWLYRTLKDPKRLAPRYLQNLQYLIHAVQRELVDSIGKRYFGVSRSALARSFHRET
jgi:N-acetylglucosaminyldiphosphoundecaprenol N-acetyl-beta-D-mannosaminyltransferase